MERVMDCPICKNNVKCCVCTPETLRESAANARAESRNYRHMLVTLFEAADMRVPKTIDNEDSKRLAAKIEELRHTQGVYHGGYVVFGDEKWWASHLLEAAETEKKLRQEECFRWQEEVEAVVDSIPGAIRVREGGGAEDVLQSLAVSVRKLVKGLEERDGII